ncbi:MAG: DUF512 domain-containing protein [Candidatus Marinimicrobia bacterium]|nr:DUF512 domain-containing protein [Candidatus Neomarinimicrobiota bacterium]
MIEIKDVEKDSIASEIGIKPGDKLVSVNGCGVSDIIDYRFLATDDNVDVVIKRNNKEVAFEIEKHPDDDMGISFVPKQYKSCCNKCVFCYVDQLPAGMRLSLYFRDGDYRLSFLHGNFVTLTNTSWKELERIVRQRLSPIYISIHVTDPETRKFMLGIDFDDDILKKIAYLDENNIEMHSQVVLCPGMNDGDILENTIKDIWNYRKNVRSMAVVPIGLTKHRDGLTKIDPVTPDYAREMLKNGAKWDTEFPRSDGKRFVYLSDEWYIMAGEPVPEEEYYDEFPQLDNGIGLVREFISELDKAKTKFPNRLNEPKEITLVTGTLAEGILNEQLLPALEKIENLKVKLLVAKNTFLGESVTIAGLLSAQDLIRTLQEGEPIGEVFLPPRILNSDGFFLDNMRPEDISKVCGLPVQVYNNDFHSLYS